MTGVFDLEAQFALIGSVTERRADGVYQARLGETVLRSVFQPIIETTGNGLQVCGYEALIRPYCNGRAIPAGTFIADAARDEVALIDQLCRALHFRNFAAFGPKNTCILVNVEPAAYSDPEQAEMAAAHSLKGLSDSGLKPQQVIYEIVERPATDERAVFAVATRLRGAGVRIAIDDFGGQALDFARLAMLQPDLLKIDGGILQNARSGGPHLKHLNRLCQVASRFGIDLLIEGIETAADFKTCQRLNPRYLQGYNFGRPVKWPLAAAHYASRLARAQIGSASGLDEKIVAAVA